MELKEYFRVITRKWWIPVITVFCCLALVYVYTTFYDKPVYEASADLIVNQPAGADAGESLVNPNSINTNLMLINTYRQIMTSEAITKYVSQQHPELGLSPQELSSKVTINTMKDTQVINLSARDASYERAAVIVNAVSQVFIERVSTIMNVDNVSILNEANLNASPDPVNNRAVILYLFAAMLGLVLGYGILFLISYLDDSITSEQEIEQVLGLTVLAKTRKAKKRDWVQQNKQDAKPAASPAAAKTMNKANARHL
ncbi:lipopolysaccharide biosynthesis protein [Paenibacillus sp. F411]|uniref:YveK family protein n=1 Tax=Paenibacillus sp. F411 TaxID=2820239 RepID=UPI001AAF5655|nr:Wzz/FepE/Etk N-terminal domain-containing protein [Paenibacillus sp. F411]MBO2944226.1 lipopolysaccharide biosynthesis protein [Paenibacillus sp. F411]